MVLRGKALHGVLGHTQKSFIRPFKRTRHLVPCLEVNFCSSYYGWSPCRRHEQVVAVDVKRNGHKRHKRLLAWLLSDYFIYTTVTIYLVCWWHPNRELHCYSISTYCTLPPSKHFFFRLQNNLHFTLFNAPWVFILKLKFGCKLNEQLS